MTSTDTSGLNRPSGREQAVARRLDPARARAEVRVQRFLETTLELINSSPSGADFTVQELVERSGQSLRSFYQYFGSKQELMLALFEESVVLAAEHLQQAIANQPSALDRLRTLIFEYYRLCEPHKGRRGAKSRLNPAMGEFARQLLTSQPAEASRAFAPVVQLFESVLKGAAEEGAVGTNLSHDLVAGVVLQSIMFNSFSRAIAGEFGAPDIRDPAEELWDLVLNGIST